VTTRSARSISTALRRRIRELGGTEELDRRDGVLIAALTTAAELADACCAPDSDVPVYARVKAIQAVGELEERLYQRTVRPRPDAFAEFLAELSVPTHGNGSARWAAGPFGEG
jgi:hypothetical protein